MSSFRFLFAILCSVFVLQGCKIVQTVGGGGTLSQARANTTVPRARLVR